MTATRSTRFFWSDWLADEAVRRLTLAERGLWIDLLALASAGVPRGYVTDRNGRPLSHEEIARVTNAASPVEVANLIGCLLSKGAASRDRSGRLLNRRMVRDHQLSLKRARAGQLGAAHMKLKSNKINGLPKQVPRQLPGQNSTALPGPYTNTDISLESEKRARARADAPVLEQKMPTEIPETVGSLATALLDGALTRQPSDRASEKKRPDQLSRAELEASFARKRSANGKGLG